MRVSGQCAVLVVAAAAAALRGPQPAVAQAPGIDPATVLSATREALGGEKRLTGVKTFVANGRTQQVRGDNLVPIEFEISVELPDKYIRKDEIPAQESGPTTIGFNGDSLIQLPVPPPPVARAGGPPPPTEAQLEQQRRARATTAKQDFARLALGMFATSFSGFPLTFTYVGQAEAPQGKADVLEAKGPANFTARLFVYRDTHLPIMVSWQGAAAPARGRDGGPAAGRAAPPPAGVGGGAAPAAAPPQGPENRLYYADYRDVDGMKFPFRLRRAVGTDTVEETTFDRFRINTKIDPKRFEVQK
jgi:hypothetical protein